jgi:hypothetical protein
VKVELYWRCLESSCCSLDWPLRTMNAFNASSQHKLQSGYGTACFLPMEKRADDFFFVNARTHTCNSFIRRKSEISMLYTMYVCTGYLLYYKFLSLEVIANISINKHRTINYCHISRRFNILVDFFISYFLLNADHHISTKKITHWTVSP